MYEESVVFITVSVLAVMQHPREYHMLCTKNSYDTLKFIAVLKYIHGMIVFCDAFTYLPDDDV